MSDRPSVERRLLWMLAVIAGVAVLGVVAIVPYRLYERDIRLAQTNAHRMASLLHVSLAQGLRESDDVTDLVNRLQGVAGLEIALQRLDQGEAEPVGIRGRGSSVLQGTDLTWSAPPILDGRGGTWMATMHFDLSPLKRDSVRLIIDLIFAVCAGSAVFSAAVWWFVRRGLVVPLRDITRRIESMADSGQPAELPHCESHEMASLTSAIARACHARQS
jgi:hypothetical protein